MGRRGYRRTVENRKGRPTIRLESAPPPYPWVEGRQPLVGLGAKPRPKLPPKAASFNRACAPRPAPRTCPPCAPPRTRPPSHRREPCCSRGAAYGALADCGSSAFSPQRPERAARAQRRRPAPRSSPGPCASRPARTPPAPSSAPVGAPFSTRAPRSSTSATNAAQILPPQKCALAADQRDRRRRPTPSLSSRLGGLRILSAHLRASAPQLQHQGLLSLRPRSASTPTHRRSRSAIPRERNHDPRKKRESPRKMSSVVSRSALPSALLPSKRARQAACRPICHFCSPLYHAHLRRRNQAARGRLLGR